MDKKGFTLVELLVAIVIVGVLTGLALPSLKQWIDGIKVKKVARQIVTDMQLAKTRAVSNALNAGLVIIIPGVLSSSFNLWAISFDIFFPLSVRDLSKSEISCAGSSALPWRTKISFFI